MKKTPFVTKDQLEEITKNILLRFICMMRKVFVRMH